MVVSPRALQSLDRAARKRAQFHRAPSKSSPGSRLRYIAVWLPGSVLKGRDRIFIFFCQPIGQTQDPISKEVIRSNLDGPERLCDCFVVAMGQVKPPPQARIKDRSKWFEFNGTRLGCNRLVIAAQ